VYVSSAGLESFYAVTLVCAASVVVVLTTTGSKRLLPKLVHTTATLPFGNTDCSCAMPPVSAVVQALETERVETHGGKVGEE